MKSLYPPCPVEGYRAVAYVTIPALENWRWIGDNTPGHIISDVDTRYVTHINFAFGMIKVFQCEPDKPGCPLMDGKIASMEAYKDPADGQYHYQVTLDGWIEEAGTTVNGGEYLMALSELKKQKPGIKVLLSVGGWDSDGFCYMSRTPETRAEFIQSCIELMRQYNIDGIDLDWEYPTNGGWGVIASCPDDVEDCKALLREMRTAFDQAFSEHKLVTTASGASQPFVDGQTVKSIDFINVMCYDFSPGSGGSQANLQRAAGLMKAHADMLGDTPENRTKLNLGIPFFNEGGAYLVPYYKGFSGHIDVNPEITREKMEWIKQNGYGGTFYWAYSMDIYEQDGYGSDSVKILQRTVYETLNP